MPSRRCSPSRRLALRTAARIALAASAATVTVLSGEASATTPPPILDPSLLTHPSVLYVDRDAAGYHPRFSNESVYAVDCIGMILPKSDVVAVLDAVKADPTLMSNPVGSPGVQRILSDAARHGRFGTFSVHQPGGDSRITDASVITPPTDMTFDYGAMSLCTQADGATYVEMFPPVSPVVGSLATALGSVDAGSLAQAVPSRLIYGSGS